MIPSARRIDPPGAERDFYAKAAAVAKRKAGCLVRISSQDTAYWFQLVKRSQRYLSALGRTTGTE